MNMNTLTTIYDLLLEKVKRTYRAYYAAEGLMIKAGNDADPDHLEELNKVRLSLWEVYERASAAFEDFRASCWFTEFKIFDGPTDPYSRATYVGSTPIWDQALAAVKNAEKRGKTYLVKGFREDGTCAWIDTWEY